MEINQSKQSWDLRVLYEAVTRQVEDFFRGFTRDVTGVQFACQARILDDQMHVRLFPDVADTSSTVNADHVTMGLNACEKFVTALTVEWPTFDATRSKTGDGYWAWHDKFDWIDVAIMCVSEPGSQITFPAAG